MSTPIIILGVPRSGTSLLADLIRRWGAVVGNEEELKAADQHNPRGYWEYLPLKRFNDKLLAHVGRNEVIPPDDEDAAQLAALSNDPHYREHAYELMRAMEQHRGGRHWCWKDPRLPSVLPFWSRIWPADTIYVIPVRNPLDIATSQRIFSGTISFPVDPFPISLPLLYWQRAMLEILGWTEGHQRKIFVEYEQLLQTPQEECERLCAFLDQAVGRIDNPGPRIAAMMEAVDPALCHHREAPALASLQQATDEQCVLYSTLRASVGEPNRPLYMDDLRIYAGWHDYIRTVVTLLGLLAGRSIKTAA